MTEIAGDAELGIQARRHMRRRDPIAAVAAVTPDGLRVAGLGATLTSDFELGSVSKGFTGLLYADACSRGEIGPETRLDELLPLHDTAIGTLTLKTLSTHRSGLPRLPAGKQPLRRTLQLMTTGVSPYGETVEEMLRQARRTKLRSPRVRYSNFGFELLGHAVSRGAEQSFHTLLRDRLVQPLGLEKTYAPATVAELSPEAVDGRSRLGQKRDPWVGEALAPAGGIRASIVDMGRFASALLDGSAPGMSALDPAAKLLGPARIGAAWIIIDAKGREITWHNGGTGGFGSWIGLDRAAGTGVVILSATAGSVDKAGFALLRELTAATRSNA